MEMNLTDFFPSAQAEKEPDCGEKASLLQELRVCVFALTEARLYLDTHPDDRQALAFYRTHKEKLERLEKEWESVFEGTADSKGCWNRIETPWPWQSQE